MLQLCFLHARLQMFLFFIAKLHFLGYRFANSFVKPPLRSSVNNPVINDCMVSPSCFRIFSVCHHRRRTTTEPAQKRARFPQVSAPVLVKFGSESLLLCHCIFSIRSWSSMLRSTYPTYCSSWYLHNYFRTPPIHEVVETVNSATIYDSGCFYCKLVLRFPQLSQNACIVETSNIAIG